MIDSLPELKEKYIEWAEDLGLPLEEILYILLHKANDEIAFLNKKLSRYENNKS